MSDTRKQTVLLVDGYSLIFRGFHALPLLTAPDGTYTNAVHGFFSMLIKALGEYRPGWLCVMMDMHAPTFRHTLYDGYKATASPCRRSCGPSCLWCERCWRPCMCASASWRATKRTICWNRRAPGQRAGHSRLCAHGRSRQPAAGGRGNGNHPHPQGHHRKPAAGRAGRI